MMILMLSAASGGYARHRTRWVMRARGSGVQVVVLMLVLVLVRFTSAPFPSTDTGLLKYHAAGLQPVHKRRGLPVSLFVSRLKCGHVCGWPPVTNHHHLPTT